MACFTYLISARRLMIGTVGMVVVLLTCTGVVYAFIAALVDILGDLYGLGHCSMARPVFSTLYLHLLMFGVCLVYALGHCVNVWPALLTLYMCRLMFGTVGMVVVMLTCAGVVYDFIAAQVNFWTGYNGCGSVDLRWSGLRLYSCAGCYLT